ncbi:MAG: class I SAM-dependent methyltransferase [Deferrisomatales bacterium]|nr:class I SAM-dependent methyltransferase [Deferrisomatales bacterium]
MDTAPINKTMDRDDLLTPGGRAFTAELNRLAESLEAKRLPVTSWYGGLPVRGTELSFRGLRALGRRLLGRPEHLGRTDAINRGGASYEPLPGVSRDDRHPWFLYWEAYWVSAHGPRLSPADRVLDAGGTASLFSCHLASRGAEVHSVDLNEELVAAGHEIARATGWNLRSAGMDMADLRFDDGTFDHAYSVCVFEHLDSGLRQRALREIARVLKPGGTLSLTFDYGAPGVYLSGRGPSCDPEHLLRTPEDVHRTFFSAPCFEPLGNTAFADNGKTYLVWPDKDRRPYTFGAVFLRKPD